MKIQYKFQGLILFFFTIATLTGCAVKGNWSETNHRALWQQQHTLTAKEAYNLLLKEGKKILFVDVRTPKELINDGKPTPIDANIPYKFAKLNKSKEKYEWVDNHHFEPSVEEQMKKKHLDKHNTIILICREGKRSAKAVNTLTKDGYKKVYSITGGMIDGWEKEDLPLSLTMDGEEVSF
jgi:rhodanese-related sulfurtransferase